MGATAFKYPERQRLKGHGTTYAGRANGTARAELTAKPDIDRPDQQHTDVYQRLADVHTFIQQYQKRPSSTRRASTSARVKTGAKDSPKCSFHIGLFNFVVICLICIFLLVTRRLLVFGILCIFLLVTLRLLFFGLLCTNLFGDRWTGNNLGDISETSDPV